MKTATVLFAFSFSLYLFTLAPVVTFVDSGELAAAVGTDGISHPSGSPFYLLLASLLKGVPFRTLIWRLNAFSALAAAASVVFTCLVWKNFPLDVPDPPPGKKKQKAPISVSPPQEITWFGGICTALFWLFNQALWNSATVTEVYALHAFLISLLFFWLFHYLRNPRLLYLLAAAFTGGLGLSNYPPFGILFPSVLFLLFRSLRPLTVAYSAVGVSAGLLPYILLPLRARTDPLLNWGNPSTWENFWNHVTARQYSIFLGTPTWNALPEALSLWFQQWPVLLYPLVPIGLLHLWQKSRRVFYFTGILAITNLIYVLSYDITDVSSAPSDYYVYLLPLCWATAIWLGAGVSKLASLINPKLSLDAGLILLVLPLVGGIGNWQEANRRHYTYADDFARSILQSLPEKSLVLTSDWTFVSPALYLQHVENVRPDVIVLDVELLRRSWYFGYVKKRAPWLYDCCRESIEAFLAELKKYETGLPYDGNVITEKFVQMMNHFLKAAPNWKYSPHILLNLQAKELNPNGYRLLEQTLGRPPYITTGVKPDAIGAGFVWVPETLAFRLYEKTPPSVLPEIKIPPRPLQPGRKYDPVTLGVFARYAEFWRWRGDYYRNRGLCQHARKAYQEALSLDPSMPEAIAGLNLCDLPP